MQKDENPKRFLGVTVMADLILNEEIQGVLENIANRAGATAVACNPTVAAPLKREQAVSSRQWMQGESYVCSIDSCGAKWRFGREARPVPIRMNPIARIRRMPRVVLTI